jgi:hypothetical protein
MEIPAQDKTVTLAKLYLQLFRQINAVSQDDS